jgi:ATP-dependent Clp protease adapter protein ClpS
MDSIAATTLLSRRHKRGKGTCWRGKQSTAEHGREREKEREQQSLID